MCEQPISAAIHQCSAHNSSLAVLVSEDELQYLAALIGGRRNGSWSFWIGGLMQTGNCVIVFLDQTAIANITKRKITISIGHNCHESHVFVCKTMTDSTHENLVLQRRQRGTVMDHRPTAVFLGSVAVAVMAAVLLFVVVIDVPNLVADVRRAKQNVKRFTTHSTNKAQPKDVTKTTP
ncbi:uncharacterized protein [Haliotis asinina]|uniref:uncharacterized protein n=1 Tax=Haliotis asinina TaxID=109174 RepID=UPI00353245CF